MSEPTSAIPTQHTDKALQREGRHKRKSVTFHIPGEFYPAGSRDYSSDDSDDDIGEAGPGRLFPSGPLLDRAIFLKTYTSNALQQVKKGQMSEYNEIVKVFSQSRSGFDKQRSFSDEQSQKLKPWLVSLSENVSSLGLSYQALVSAILHNDWLSSNDQAFVEIQVEVEELELRQNTDIPNNDYPDEPPNSPESDAIFDMEIDGVHQQKSSQINIDAISDPLPKTNSLNQDSGEQVVGSESDESDSEAELEDDGDTIELSYNVTELIAKLDTMLDLLLSWLRTQFNEALQDQSKQPAFHQLFLNCIEIFDNVLLPTFKSRYTQFVVFYLCSLDTYFCDLFLGNAVAKLGDPIPQHQLLLKEGESVVIRVAAASYIGSFVARAKYVSSEVVRNVMGVLVQWVNTYLDWLEESSSDTSAKKNMHDVFYSVSQAIMYIFCFRWRDLTLNGETENGPSMDIPIPQSPSPKTKSSISLWSNKKSSPDPRDLKWCPELSGIHRLIFSRLNPLKANESTSTAEQYYGPGKTEDILHHELETFFPFDPISLTLCRSYIDDLYLVWQGIGDEDDDASDDEDEDEEEDEDEDGQSDGHDNDKPDMSKGLSINRNNKDINDQFVAMSISPVPFSVPI
ncbi:DNA independent RNA polymerase I transcription factor [Mycoemilia scoparia]|uniref:DNA independent RNA polymerase I transcription factor n=1 Tax=Mycoemilia scoparia TaxID=417184 RepID=A0A9W8A278_9FUNG|nr:DNA independent RNA polymerase I transcription factor [Mycoemilia scoparia]